MVNAPKTAPAFTETGKLLVRSGKKYHRQSTRKFHRREPQTKTNRFLKLTVLKICLQQN